ncbi:putative sugar nucleotidyl transferase [Flavicella sediminum]|uniref:putative sugar nucleotidyl transferase n=1 Tax=Flavicella sediminum TaxID=2585141 RepID=UPI00112006AA|nr:putative sugar nucleotidyl transferase [Flavicella sediminum]
MNYILFDGPFRDRFLPLTYTRPVAELRIGILTIKEKWEKHLGSTCTVLTEDYLEEKFPMVEMEQNIFIDASVLPTESLAEEISFLSENELLVHKDEVLAFYAGMDQEQVDFSKYEAKEYSGDLIQISNLKDLFLFNDKALRADYDLLTKDKVSAELSNTNQVLGAENIFIEDGATVEFAMLNATTGPIYIAKNSLIMEGSMIRGPFAIHEKAVVKMGAKIYGATTVGPNCTVGGEIKNVIFIANSNKGHDGYLGDSVVGAWCNLGANTNGSNLKNTFSNVHVWDFETERFEDTGSLKFGAVLGDYTKTAINTSLNTGTITGVCCHVFGADFPDKFLPSFSWGTPKEVYALEKAKEAAKKIQEFKKETFSELDAHIFEILFELRT